MASVGDSRHGAQKRFQFSLKGLFYLVTIIAVFLGAGRALGPQISLDFAGFLYSAIFVVALIALLTPFDALRRKWPAYTDTLASVAVNILATISFFVFDRLIRRVDPDFDDERSWLTALFVFIPLILIFVVARLAAVDQPSRRHERELPYFPLTANVVRALRIRRIRLLLILGVGLALRYYSVTVVEGFGASLRYRSYDRTPRFAVTCMLLWGLFWFVDCLTRPGKATKGAPIVYLCVATFLAAMYVS